jgi:protein TonB
MYVSMERPPRSHSSGLDLTFAFGASRAPGRELVFIALALAVHGALAFAARGGAPVLAPPLQVTEIELPPPPAPEKVTPPPPEEVKAPSEPQPTRPSSAPPPQAARAGALLTAKESAAPSKDEPLVDFVTDPSGTSYGSGVVAHGGTADHAERGATVKGTGAAPAAPNAAPVGDGLTPAADLSRRATLSEANACAGFYPSEASADSGTVALTLVVRADGSVTSAAVVSESPAGQGFGLAARSCLQRKRFEPSLDRAGKAVAAATTIRVRFVR